MLPLLALLLVVLAPPADLGEQLAPLIEKHAVPGMTAVVREGESVVAKGVAGVRKNGFPDKVGPDDLFHLGSCTKAMTATMIATLVEERKLRWETTVGEVFSDVPMQEQWKA